MVIATETPSDHTPRLDHGGVTRRSGRPKPGKSYQASIVEKHGPSLTQCAHWGGAVLFSHRDSLGACSIRESGRSRIVLRVDMPIWARSVRSVRIIGHAKGLVNDHVSIVAAALTFLRARSCKYPGLIRRRLIMPSIILKSVGNALLLITAIILGLGICEFAVRSFFPIYDLSGQLRWFGFPTERQLARSTRYSGR